MCVVDTVVRCRNTEHAHCSASHFRNGIRASFTPADADAHSFSYDGAQQMKKVAKPRGGAQLQPAAPGQTSQQPLPKPRPSEKGHAVIQVGSADSGAFATPPKKKKKKKPRAQQPGQPGQDHPGVHLPRPPPVAQGERQALVPVTSPQSPKLVAAPPSQRKKTHGPPDGTNPPDTPTDPSTRASATPMSAEERATMLSGQLKTVRREQTALQQRLHTLRGEYSALHAAQARLRDDLYAQKRATGQAEQERDELIEHITVILAELGLDAHFHGPGGLGEAVGAGAERGLNLDADDGIDPASFEEELEDVLDGGGTSRKVGGVRLAAWPGDGSPLPTGALADRVSSLGGLGAAGAGPTSPAGWRTPGGSRASELVLGRSGQEGTPSPLLRELASAARSATLSPSPRQLSRRLAGTHSGSAGGSSALEQAGAPLRSATPPPVLERALAMVARGMEEAARLSPLSAVKGQTHSLEVLLTALDSATASMGGAAAAAAPVDTKLASSRWAREANAAAAPAAGGLPRSLPSSPPPYAADSRPSPIAFATSMPARPSVPDGAGARVLSPSLLWQGDARPMQMPSPRRVPSSGDSASGTPPRTTRGSSPAPFDSASATESARSPPTAMQSPLSRLSRGLPPRSGSPRLRPGLTGGADSSPSPSPSPSPKQSKAAQHARSLQLAVRSPSPQLFASLASITKIVQRVSPRANATPLAAAAMTNRLLASQSPAPRRAASVPPNAQGQ